MLQRESLEDVKLTARLAGGDARSVHLEWTLVNDSPRPLVVLRHLYRTFDEKGRLQVEPNLAYVSVGDDGVVHISKKLLRVPSGGVQVFTPFVSLGEELVPGGRLNETIAVRVPITSWDPYDELVQQVTGHRAMKKVESKALCFHLGVYSLDPASPPPTRVETGVGELIYPNYQTVLDAQTVLGASPVPWTGEAYR